MKSLEKTRFVNFLYAKLGGLAAVIVEVDHDYQLSTGSSFGGGSRKSLVKLVPTLRS